MNVTMITFSRPVKMFACAALVVGAALWISDARRHVVVDFSNVSRLSCNDNGTLPQNWESGRLFVTLLPTNQILMLMSDRNQTFSGKWGASGDTLTMELNGGIDSNGNVVAFKSASTKTIDSVKLIGHDAEGALLIETAGWRAKCIVEMRAGHEAGPGAPAQPEASLAPALFSPPVSYVAANIQRAADSSEKVEIAAILADLVPQGFHPIPVTGDENNLDSYLFEVANSKESLKQHKQMISDMGELPASTRLAALATFSALYEGGSRIDALRGLVNAKSTTTSAFMDRCLQELLLAPGHGVVYPDLVFEFFQKQIAVGIKNNYFSDSTAGPARVLQNLTRKSILHPSIAGHLKLNGSNQYLYEVEGGSNPPVSQSLSAYFKQAIADAKKRVPLDAQTNAFVAQASFRAGLAIALRSSAWELIGLRHDVNKHTISGAIQSPVMGVTAPFSISVNADEARDLMAYTHTKVNPVFRIEPGQKLVIEKIFLNLNNFYAQAVVNWEIDALVPALPNPGPNSPPPEDVFVKPAMITWRQLNHQPPVEGEARIPTPLPAGTGNVQQRIPASNQISDKDRAIATILNGIVDERSILSQSDRAELGNLLFNYNRNGNEIKIVLKKTTAPETLATYAASVRDHLAATLPKNKYVTVFVVAFENDKSLQRLNISTSCPAKEKMPAQIFDDILKQTTAPAFSQGEYSTGVLRTVNAIVTQLPCA